MDKETREALCPKARRQRHSLRSESLCPLTVCGISQLPTPVAYISSCVKGTEPPACPPPQGAGVPCRENSHKRVSHTGRPSADVRVIIIILPPPDGMVAPSSACQEAPLSGPQRCKGPLGLGAASNAPSLSSAWASLQLTASFFRCKDPSNCQQAAPRRGTSRWGKTGVTWRSPGTKAGWELAGRHQGSMHNGPGGWRLRSWPIFA